MQNAQPDRLLAMLNAFGTQNPFQQYNLFANRDFQSGLNASTSNLGIQQGLGSSSFLPYALNGLNAKCQNNMMNAPSLASNNNNDNLSSAEKFLLDSPLNLSRGK